MSYGKLDRLHVAGRGGNPLPERGWACAASAIGSQTPKKAQVLPRDIKYNSSSLRAKL